MTTENKRRHFIRAGLVIPLLGTLPWHSSTSQAVTNTFSVPENIHATLFKLYGNAADHIRHTDRILIHAPDIAENRDVVPFGVKGDKGYVTSLALFVAKNTNPLATTYRLHHGADLDLSTRVKLKESSDIYVIAATTTGLVGVKKNVKATIGCGGG